MTSSLKKNISIFIIFFITCLFFYKTIIKGLIPFPGDMLVGAYYPWLDHKWGGFVTSVPVKNPEITDVFSQIFLWKKLIINSLKSNNIPLWNQFSYSGYPLLANFQSGVFNPFNILMTIFGSIYGWAFIIFCQFFLSTLNMYLYLKELYKDKTSSIIGAVSYGFSGFAIVWSQFATAGFAMIWLPLIFLNIERFFKTNNLKYLFFLSPLYFLLMTSGHFQALIYGCLFSGFYFLWKLINNSKKTKTKIIFFAISVILGIALMAIQLLPTVELSKYSVRFFENYISGYNYGLISLDRIVTFFAPDYFGNPSTINFWGSSNYFETIIYMGIIAIFSFIFSIFNFKKLKNEKFFFIFNIVVLLLVFNTIFGKLIYLSHFPGLSTSSAGRIVFLSVFCFSVLISFFIENISVHNLKTTLRYYWGYFLFLFIISISTLIMYKTAYLYPILQKNYMVALRNLFIPILLSSSIIFILAFIKNNNLKRILILFLIIFDLFRFGWKYTPFVSSEYIFPKTNITSFLQNQSGLFRIEKENGPLLTPNTWTAYDLSSPSGYDPMALNDYSRYFHGSFNNQIDKPVSSRYSEINNYKAKELGEANVKYLLALKYDDIDKISPDGDHLNYKINQNEWNKVYEYGSVVLLENKEFKPRIEILNQNSQESIRDINYSSNKVSFFANSVEGNSILVLRDTWYPGWKAYINDIEVPIDKYLNIYRQIIIPKGESKIKFIYHPKSFYYGFYISSFAFIVWLIFIIKFNNKKV